MTNVLGQAALTPLNIMCVEQMYCKASFYAGLEESSWEQSAVLLSLHTLSQNLAAAPTGKCQLNS